MSDRILTAVPVAPTTEPTWFYLVNGQQCGPVTQQQLLQLSTTGQVNPDTLVWREGLLNWIVFSDTGIDLPMAMQPAQGAVLNYSKGEDDPTNIFGWWWYVVSKNYANMRGRARRKEFWSFVLVNIVILMPLILFGILIDAGRGGGASALGVVMLIVALCVYLGLIVPYICAVVRRLHDSGKSGWCFFVTFVPYVGGIILLVLLALESEPGVNRFGPNPKSALRGRV